MFAKATNVGFAQRVVATLVACSVVLWSIGVYSTAQAANLTDVSDTLTDSGVSVVSDHTISFTVPAGSPGVLAGGTITVTFPAGFNMGSVAFGDVDLSINAGDQTLAAAPSGATWGAVVSSQTLTLTSGTGTAGPGDIIEIQIGTNAAGGSNQITNPTAGSYEIVVTAGAADTGKTRVAIIDSVLVSAIVNTSFDFVITGIATGTAVNGDNTTGSTSPTEINFGELVANTPELLAQELSVATNAINGFSVTVQSDGDLESSTGAIIDSFTDGTDISVAGTAWAAPSNSLLDPLTWGHWGMTSNDANLANDLVTGSSYIAVSTSPREVFSHSGPSDGITQNHGLATVGYQIEITPLQEAADDYNTNLTYIATPTF
ncbi:hypothetical protein H6781_01330 [Candidatus Nomurabacteria bacterium]|nr:hypothetical protein [Candidatus Nomurabacteria bacterium]MCB9818128.1 hypothetical protein [Candidatus Nomurabacteria bacterium]